MYTNHHNYHTHSLPLVTGLLSAAEIGIQHGVFELTTHPQPPPLHPPPPPNPPTNNPRPRVPGRIQGGGVDRGPVEMQLEAKESLMSQTGVTDIPGT